MRQAGPELPGKLSLAQWALPTGPSPLGATYLGQSAAACEAPGYVISAISDDTPDCLKVLTGYYEGITIDNRCDKTVTLITEQESPEDNMSGESAISIIPGESANIGINPQGERIQWSLMDGGSGEIVTERNFVGGCPGALGCDTTASDGNSILGLLVIFVIFAGGFRRRRRR